MEAYLKSQPNFRDLGGVQTHSGKKVKSEILFRSGFPGNLESEEIELLKKLDVRRIIDLRTQAEIDLLGKGEYPNFIVYQNVSLNTGNITKALIPIFEKGEFHLIESGILNKIYLDLIVNFQQELAHIFRTFIEEEKGLVFHCSHGKDRTGIISALFLDLLEVDREHIYEDYVLSNEFRKRENEYQIQKIKENFARKFNREVSDDEFAPVKALFYCHPEVLKHVFDYLEKEYGSVSAYFESGLGLSKQEIDQLKSKYTE